MAGSGNHFSYGQSAQAALTWTHAASAEGLRLVRPETAKLHEMPEFAGRDFLAAAHNHLIPRHAIFIAWPIEAVEERTNAHDITQATKQRRGAAIARGGVDRAKLCGNRQRCHFALRFRRLRAADAAAVACNEDAGDIEFAPLIGDR